MAKEKKRVATTPIKRTKSKKYQTKAIDTGCLNCTLPTSVCCGTPRLCKVRYERLFAKQAKEESKKRRSKRKEKCIKITSLESL